MENEARKKEHPITVAVVEDNSDYRMGISFILRNSPSLSCVGEFTTAEDFLEAAGRQQD